MFLNRTVTLTTVALFTLTRPRCRIFVLFQSILLRTSFVQFPDKIVDLVINFIIFLLPDFFDKRLASWNTEKNVTLANVNV
jgi:hypothetical protein